MLVGIGSHGINVAGGHCNYIRGGESRVMYNIGIEA